MTPIRGLIRLHDYLFMVITMNGQTRLSEAVHFNYENKIYQINQDTPYYALRRLMRMIDIFRNEITSHDAAHSEIFVSATTETGEAIKLQHEKDYYYFYRFHEDARTPSRF